MQGTETQVHREAKTKIATPSQTHDDDFSYGNNHGLSSKTAG